MVLFISGNLHDLQKPQSLESKTKMKDKTWYDDRLGDNLWSAADQFCKEILIPLMVDFSKAMLHNQINEAANLLLEIHGVTKPFINHKYSQLPQPKIRDTDGLMIPDPNIPYPILPPDYDEMLYDLQQSIAKNPPAQAGTEGMELTQIKSINEMIRIKRELNKVRQSIYSDISELLIPLMDKSKKLDIRKVMRE